MGIDVSESSVAHTRALAARHDVRNLEVRHLPIEAVEDLEERFDHIVCTGVLHHLADPDLGLSCLRDVLAPDGAVTLMVYARYGRTGVYMLQDYCRRVGVGTSSDELADLVDTLREIPLGHPLSRLLRESRDFADDDALADALLNPRDRAYSVPELFELIEGAGLRFGRWERQAPYLPDCGSPSETPHASRIGALPPPQQYAAVELLRGTAVRHTVIAFAADDAASGEIDFGEVGVGRWVPIRTTTSVAVEERLPPGAAAALLNRAHSDSDLVLFVDRFQLEMFRTIDGRPDGRRARSWRSGARRAAVAPRPSGHRPDRRRSGCVTRAGHDIVTLAGGEFAMGSDEHYPEESPVHRVRIATFGIDRYEVTNTQFREFVDATGYLSVAERPLDPTDFPGAPPENLVPGSLVFTPTRGPVDLMHLTQWWTWTPSASWHAPEGPGSTLQDREQHPSGACRPRGRGGVLGVGRCPSADRGGVGARCSWWSRRSRVHVG